ncbi:hypothetical protein LWI28_002432 [Acer negundo]|uniref:Uncharacterized protein n=1 Tax=Acer negundo TaxID=4023 RepID=A0AAD5P5C0_ACENE|nr:hypothetical protein LWI28_002432 [Acer negundo]
MTVAVAAREELCLFSSIGNGKEEETDSSLEALDELVFELWWPLERSEADHRNSTCSRAETGLWENIAGIEEYGRRRI